MKKIKRLIAFLMAIMHKKQNQEYTGENLPFTLIDALKRT